MTTSPVANRTASNPRFETQDTAGTQQTLGELRAAWPVPLGITGPGTATDAESWNTTSAVVIDISLSVQNPMGTLTGGTVIIEVDVSGQSSYSGSDGFRPVVSPIVIPAGGTAFEKLGVLGKAYVLTTNAQTPRIRISNTSMDEVQLIAMVAPIAQNPTCP